MYAIRSYYDHSRQDQVLLDAGDVHTELDQDTLFDRRERLPGDEHGAADAQIMQRRAMRFPPVAADRGRNNFV